MLSIGFLVHARDFAQATGQQVTVSDALAEHVPGVAYKIITPEAHAGGSFAGAIPPDPDAQVLVQMIAFTGRAA